jgi:hypothetical protein
MGIKQNNPALTPKNMPRQRWSHAFDGVDDDSKLPLNFLVLLGLVDHCEDDLSTMSLLMVLVDGSVSRRSLVLVVATVTTMLVHDLGVHEALGEEYVEQEGVHVHVQSLIPRLAVGLRLCLPTRLPRRRRTQHQALLRIHRRLDQNHSVEQNQSKQAWEVSNQTWWLLGVLGGVGNCGRDRRGGGGMREMMMEADCEKGDGRERWRCHGWAKAMKSKTHNSFLLLSVKATGLSAHFVCLIQRLRWSKELDPTTNVFKATWHALLRLSPSAFII